MLGMEQSEKICLQEVTHCHTSSHVSHQPACSDDRNPLHKLTVMDGDPSGVCHHQSTWQSTSLYCQQPIVKDRIQNSMQLSRFVHISVISTRGLSQLYDNNGDILRFQPWLQTGLYTQNRVSSILIYNWTRRTPTRVKCATPMFALPLGIVVGIVTEKFWYGCKNGWSES